MEQIMNASITLAGQEGIKALVKACINSYIKPKLDEKYKKLQSEKEYDSLEEHIQEYLERTFKSNLIMNTIVFKNRQKTIDDLYFPLTICNDNLTESGLSEKVYIDRYPEEIIEKYKKILIVDNAGMGKSTILKFLYLSVIREKKGIPILIEVRKLNKDIAIIDYIASEMNGIKDYFTRDYIAELIEEGDFIFLFDGYDEISYESKEKITQNIQDFIIRCGNNKFFITSREENELACFGDFQRFNIQSLKKEEAYELIKKYDEDGERSKKIIEKLKTEENFKIINEFLENPLMVSLLYKAFEYKESIPYKKNIFYRQVYDALFEEHDLSKTGAYNRTKKSGLDLDDFHKILRCIGFITLAKGINYSIEELMEIIKKAKNKTINCSFSENDFIDDLTHSVPLFIKDGNEYRWSHKSFQEYFAANYIAYDANEKQEQLLEQLVSESKINKYYNVLDFYYDINYKQFSRVILYPILNKLEQYVKNSYTDKYFKNIDSDDLKLRKEICFSNKNINIRILSKEESEELYNVEPNVKFSHLFPDSKMADKFLTNEILAMSIQRDYLTTLTRLLYNKKSNIVKVYRRDNKRTTFSIYNEICERLEVGSYTIDESLDNILNDIDMFNLINCYIAEIGFRNNMIRINSFFDYDKCMELKSKIEEDIENEKGDLDFL